MKAPPVADAGEDIASLAEKVRILEGKVAVMNLLGRYSLNIDLGRAEALLALFTDDCVFASDVGGAVDGPPGKGGTR
jgi:hypothetical protein